MCSNRDAFYSLKGLPQHHQVHIGDSAILEDTGTGSVFIGDILLRDVLHVSHLHCNLVSVIKVI